MSLACAAARSVRRTVNSHMSDGGESGKAKLNLTRISPIYITRSAANIFGFKLSSAGFEN